jgi:ABC-type polysaccharide/polyol phosphate export permease
MLIEGLPIRQTILVMPLIMTLQFLFTLVLAYPLAAVFVRFRDTQHILSVVLNLMFYMTPIFYSVSSVAPQCRWIYNFNPMSTLIQSYRDILIAGVQPNWSALAIIAATTLCLLPLSRHMFKNHSTRFVEEL